MNKVEIKKGIYFGGSSIASVNVDSGILCWSIKVNLKQSHNGLQDVLIQTFKKGSTEYDNVILRLKQMMIDPYNCGFICVYNKGQFEFIYG